MAGCEPPKIRGMHSVSLRKGMRPEKQNEAVRCILPVQPGNVISQDLTGKTRRVIKRMEDIYYGKTS